MKLFQNQLWHLLSLLILLLAIYSIVDHYPKCLKGSFLGVTTYEWLLLAIITPIVHQVYVLIAWRSELYYQGLTRVFRKSAFKVYKVGFYILIVSRVLALILLAIANRSSLEITDRMMIGLSLTCLLPSAYLFYSVVKYFGFDRAIGIDHFKPEEARQWPMVDKGIFKFTNNGMYVFGFLALYIPALVLASKTALLIALFNHLYIWVHFYCTELPDMKEIYKGN